MHDRVTARPCVVESVGFRQIAGSLDGGNDHDPGRTPLVELIDQRSCPGSCIRQENPLLATMEFGNLGVQTVEVHALIVEPLAESRTTAGPCTTAFPGFPRFFRELLVFAAFLSHRFGTLFTCFPDWLERSE